MPKIGFLESLVEDQRPAATYRFTDNAQRASWSNLPEGMVPRGRAVLGALSETQRQGLDAPLGEFLSECCGNNITCQLAAEDMLVPGVLFGFMKYGRESLCVAFHGEPSTLEPWVFQFGGHHPAINSTVFAPSNSLLRMLTGGQPLHLCHDCNGMFKVQGESAAALASMDGLMDELRKRAIHSERPIDLLPGPGKYGKAVASEGTVGSEFATMQGA